MSSTAPRLLLLAVASGLLASTLGHATAGANDREDPLPRVPPGFAVSVFSDVEGLATSLDFGPDTRGGKAERLYVSDFARGRIMAIDDLGGIGSPPQVFADGFDSPLGVLAHDDGTVYVADSEGPRKGPFGNRVYGRVWRLEDTDKDGVADRKQLVLKDLPNGRHNTNGLAMGADGMLYVTNGNSTDDGVEGGDPEVVPWSGAVVRVDPKLRNASLARLPRNRTLVATGMRNLYDLAFSPLDRTKLFIPMNGTDDAREGSTGGGPTAPIENSDDLLYVTDVRGGADDFGFPSCLYNFERQGDLEPYDNPNPQVIIKFGTCPKNEVPRPATTFGLHVSADGLAFQSTKAWGKDFRNDLFVAEFGNFFGDEVVGHRVVRVELDKRGKKVVRHSEFLSGAAPLDVTFDESGTMFVADFAGTIYRVERVVELPRTVDVSINGFQFLPQVLTIPEGTTVRWTNQETLGLIHNVRGQVAAKSTGVVDDGSEIDSDDLAIGKSHTYRFETPGTYVYTCTVNAVHTALMHGVITVVPAGN